MSFLAAGRLWLLVPVAAVIVGYVLVQGRRTRYAVRFTNLALLDRVAPRRPGWRRHVPAALFLLVLTALVTGFARPTTTVTVPRERATIIVAIDVSPSMQATDVAPNRFESAKDAAKGFIDSLPPRFNVGLVWFARTAVLAVPPTTDRQAVRNGIDQLQLTEATAIGEAVFTSLKAIKNVDAEAETDPPPARIVLLSDGDNTAGRTPEEAATAARRAHVPVSTIAYGTASGYIINGGKRDPVPPDKTTLRELARATGGQAYESTSSAQLREVYADIGSSIGHRNVEREVTTWFVGIALLLAFAAAGTSLAWFSRLP